MQIPLGGGTPNYLNRPQEYLKKRNGGTFPPGFFDDSENSGISGVLFCPNNILNHTDPLGSDFTFLPNRHALNPLPTNFLQIGSEYIIEPDGYRYEEYPTN